MLCFSCNKRRRYQHYHKAARVGLISIIIRRYFKLKKSFFTLSALVLFFLITTVVLHFLEKTEVVNTSVPEDKITGDINDLFDYNEKNGETYFIPNNPEIIDRHLFKLKKSPETIRVFLIGGSFLAGTPYVHFEPDDQGNRCPGTLPLWVRGILEDSFPNHKFEILNLGIGGMNSTGVLHLVTKMPMAKPDLVIVATGNNEGFVPKTDLNQPFHKWVLYRALKKTLLKLKPGEMRPFYMTQDPDTKKIENQFRSNIDEIIRFCERNEMKLALCTLPINIKSFGIFKWARKENGFMLQTDEYMDKAYTFYQSKNYEKAIRELGKSNHHVMAAYCIAMCMEAQKQTDLARETYRLLVQEVPVNRTRPSYNEYIRTVADKNNLPLVDLEKYHDSLFPDRLPNARYFVDHCHMNWWGYWTMAGEVSRQIAPIIIPDFDPGTFEIPPIEEIIKKRSWERLSNGPEGQIPILLDDFSIGGDFS